MQTVIMKMYEIFESKHRYNKIEFVQQGSSTYAKPYVTWTYCNHTHNNKNNILLK